MRLRLQQSLLLMTVLTGLGLTCVRADIAITQVTADNRENRLTAQTTSRSYPAIRLPSSAKTITLNFRNATDADEQPLRYRYKMEGHDLGWHELKSEMVVWFRLLDQTGSIVAGDVLALKGETPGWTGHPEDAPLVPCKMELTAPRQADRMMVFFISGGDQKNLGQLVAQDITLSVSRTAGSLSETFALDCETAPPTGNPLDSPLKWKREGERPEIAKVLRRATPDRKMALLLDDTDPHKFGVWCSRDLRTPLSQGDRVTLRWNAAYSIGQGQSGTATYSNLKPGNYWFRVAAFQSNGLPTGEEVSLPVIMVPPLTHRLEFWIILLVVVGIFLAISVRWITQRQSRQQMELVERRRMLEEERTRIARDIHDDLGATMTQIAMFSEVAQSHANAAVRDFLNDIFNCAHEATRSLDEIVWAIKPENDSLESLIRYLSRFVESYLRLAGLRFRLDAPDDLPSQVLTSTQRHNLFLTAKEAVHNVVKHAHASEVWLRIKLHNNVLHLRIEDNGNGDAPALDASLNRGSANMKQRMEQIGGTCTRIGTHGKGTTVSIAFPLTKES
jgi:signal transduction histidine kinase